jgi:hypothetical protein
MEGVGTVAGVMVEGVTAVVETVGGAREEAGMEVVVKVVVAGAAEGTGVVATVGEAKAVEV